jgi:hypothetical protein
VSLKVVCNEKEGGQEGGKQGLGQWRSRFVVSFNFAVVLDFNLSSVIDDERETREKNPRNKI